MTTLVNTLCITDNCDKLTIFFCELCLEQMVPFIVDQLYGWKLRQIEKISIAGVQSRFYYLSFPGYMYMLQDLFKDFRVKENDTLIFTLNGSKTINCRIYQDNGMEIDYVYRSGRKKGGGSVEWIWNSEPQTATGINNCLL